MGRALWIPDKLREYGLKVVEIDGWKTRGDDNLTPKGLVCHHTASTAGADHPALGICINGRSDLPGPLCQVLLSRNGTCYVVASGVANHAGSGGWKGLSGNSQVLGIEAENNGLGEPWNNYDQYIACAAALQDGANFSTDYICGHKEWTTRKIDPYGIDMNEFRRDVKEIEGGWLMGAKQDILNAIARDRRDNLRLHQETRQLLRKAGVLPPKGQEDSWLEKKLKEIETQVGDDE